jgi:hypothetical protein
MLHFLFIAFGLLLTIPCIATEKIPTKHQFTITLPDGWVQMEDATIAESLKAVAGSANKTKIDYAFQKASNVPFNSPYIIMEVKNFKYTKARIEKLVADLPTTKIPANTVKEGISVKDIVTFKPFYDATSNIVWWSMEAEAGGRKIKTVSAFLFTEKSSILINCYTTPEAFNDTRPIFESIIRNIEIDKAIKYKNSIFGMEFLENTDGSKIASAAVLGVVLSLIYRSKRIISA